MSSSGVYCSVRNVHITRLLLAPQVTGEIACAKDWLALGSYQN